VAENRNSAGNGASTGTLLAFSGHASVASLFPLHACLSRRPRMLAGPTRLPTADADPFITI
jgi:hypothetical protein